MKAKETEVWRKALAKSLKREYGCKHKFVVYNVKRWWFHATFIYCEKCGKGSRII